ncbi:MAG: hypothetical protein M3068_04555 [Gemmatimonadota bacterium]|nr:hypothetical protein [Gemmatimonadota bacterium]
MSRTGQLLVGIALLGGCGTEPIVTEATSRVPARAMAEREAARAAVSRDLAALRRATAPFHKFEKAVAAGWSAQITPCMTSPEGGMGFHYGNTSLFDGSVRVEEPELLLYEPEEDGRLRLVAVEYIIPYSAHSRSAAPPVLFGQEFKQNDTFQLWGLHAWVWKENPSGMFANWNPKVTCDQTDAVSTMVH